MRGLRKQRKRPLNFHSLIVWDKDPFAQVIYSLNGVNDGVWDELSSHKKEGLFLADEDLNSVLKGYMEDAVQSGLKVYQGIIGQHRLKRLVADITIKDVQ